MRQLDTLKSSILKPEDFKFLSEISDELTDSLKKRQMFRTETEMAISVLDDIHHPTVAAKYWQSVREQAVMFEALMTDGFDHRRTDLKIRRLRRDLESCSDEFDREEIQINLEEAICRLANIELVAKDRIRELRLWSKIKKELDDGSFDTEDVNTHQLVSYAQRFILQASNVPANMPVAEANNLYGQLQTSVKELTKRGIMPLVLNGLPAHVIDNVLVNRGLVQRVASTNKIGAHEYKPNLEFVTE